MSQPQPDEILEQARKRIATRNAAREAKARSATARHDRYWAIAFLSLLGLVVLGLLFWPGADLSWKLYAAVHGLVAQKHLILLDGKPLPVCARNIGIYSSFVISLIYLWVSGRRLAAGLPSRSLLVALGLGALAMAFDGVNSLLEDTGRTYLYVPRNDLRTITGVFFGIAITPIILMIFNQALRVEADRSQPVLEWRDMGWLLLLNGLLILAIYSRWALFYWPLAIFGVVSIFSELFVMFLLLASVGFGLSRQVSQLSQLARPAFVALILTLAFGGGLAMLRFAGEGVLAW